MLTGTKSIPARLKKLGYATYQDYLRSEHWQKLRQKFFRKSSRLKRLKKLYGYLVCELCEQAGVLNVHHVTYKRMGAERLGDLFLICENCHFVIHETTRRYPRVTMYAASFRLRTLWKRFKEGQRVIWHQFAWTKGTPYGPY